MAAASDQLLLQYETLSQKIKGRGRGREGRKKWKGRGSTLSGDSSKLSARRSRNKGPDDSVSRGQTPPSQLQLI